MGLHAKMPIFERGINYQSYRTLGYIDEVCRLYVPCNYPKGGERERERERERRTKNIHGELFALTSAINK